MDSDTDRDKICCIILNYNDAKTAAGLAQKLKQSRLLDDILLVDNCSSDDSWEQFKKLELGWKKEEREGDGIPGLWLIRTDENRGYGSGNQAGIDYAMEYLEPDYIVIANPDVDFSDECLERLHQALKEREDGALASAMVTNPEGQELFSYWDLLPMWKDLLDTDPLTRRIFAPVLKTPLQRLPESGNGNTRIVGALPGSFFMIKTGCFTPGDLEELFDKNVFLYYEEKILGQKLKELGLKALLATDARYVHAHSVTIDKCYRKAADRQRLLHESKLYYYKHYLHRGPAALAAARVFLAAVLAEVKILTGVLGLKAGR